MLASTTQETLVDDDLSSSHGMFLRSISTLDANDFNNYIQQHYGACWGSLKFEDSLSDYSNDVRIYRTFIKISNKQR
jgi:hypothetical protein